VVNALDYLKQLPAVWINLERSPARAEQFSRMTAPLFAAAYHVPAYDGVKHYDPDTAAFQWRDAMLDTVQNKDDRGIWTTVTNFQAGDKYLKSQPGARALYACTMAVFYSHLKAIQYGYDAGWERFVVLEDDAVPRTQALASCPAPQPSHINVWGGAIPMAGHKSDESVFQAGRTMAWDPLPSGKRLDKLYCATAYELTREAAKTFLERVTPRPLPFDIAWWYPMDVLGGYRLVPTGFIQTGVSERSGSKRRIGATSTEVKA
jgi:GR25 family glycosyltransferase involved in LPS biosynthesis